MDFPANHFQHNCAVEWFYFWAKFKNQDSFFHHVLFKTNVGNSQRLMLHSSLDGDFKEVPEEEIEKYGYSTGFRDGRFVGSNVHLSFSLSPLSDPVVFRCKPKEVYYSIPFLAGEAILNNKPFEIEGWFDHEYFNFPENLRELRHRREWDWKSARFKDGSFFMSYGDTVFGKIEGDIEEKKEVIFDTKVGHKYSETPFFIMRDGIEVGYGMRERVYGRA